MKRLRRGPEGPLYPKSSSQRIFSKS